MSKLADDLCAEVRRQCEQADNFKGLWMRANDELETLRASLHQVIFGTAKKLGCEEDYSKILEAAARLRAENEALRQRLSTNGVLIGSEISTSAVPVGRIRYYKDGGTRHYEQGDCYIEWATTVISPDGAEIFMQPVAAPAVPGGWKLVPVEPTDEMYAACDNQRLAHIYWRRLLAAAPTSHAAVAEGGAS